MLLKGIKIILQQKLNIVFCYGVIINLCINCVCIGNEYNIGVPNRNLFVNMC